MPATAAGYVPKKKADCSMRRLSIALMLALATSLSVPQHAGADELSPQTVAAQLRVMGEKLGGCTAIRHRIRSANKQVSGHHFAFAGRKAATFSGIRGCGWAYSRNRAEAEAKAMQNCRKWEQEYGTGGGGKVCKLMN